MGYQKLKDAVRITGLHPNTLRKYADDGTIPSIRTPSGQRLFDVDAFIGKQQRVKVVLYARVSSVKQQDDLQRQIEYLRSKEPDAEVVTDIASGLNFKRKGLKTLLERCLQGDKLTIMVAHRDRLARFGFDLIEWIVERNGGKIVVLNKSHYASPSDELVQDIIAILSVFAARIHGLRRYRDQIKEDTALSDSGTETHLP
jgi:putative resolvase